MQENYEYLMEAVKEKAKEGVSGIAYETWISPAELYSIENNIATLIVPTPFFADQLKPYEILLQNCFKAVTNKIYNINYITADKIGQDLRKYKHFKYK